MQVQALIDYFEQLATLHILIESFGTGDRWEVAIAGETKYPELWLEQVFNYSETDNLAIWDVAFIIHAIQKHDESDEINLQNITQTIGRQIIERIKQDKLYILGDGINAVSFTEAFEDFTTGWRFEIQLRERLTDRCEIDFIYLDTCNYTASIDTFDTLQFYGIEQGGGGGALFLPGVNFPISMTDFAGAAANAAALEAALIGLGYTATVTQSIGDRGLEYSFNIEQTQDVFLILKGQRANKVFSVDCTPLECCLEINFVGALLNESINQIRAGGSPLTLTNLPLNTALSNTNFNTEVAALESELAGLGYPITFTDNTVGGDTYRTLFLQMCEDAATSDLESIITKSIINFTPVNCP